MDDQKLSLSIIIPAYNEEVGIRNVLEKLIPIAKEHEWPILVVDDGSTDRTADVVREFEYCTLLQQPYNKGYGAAVKAGARRAETDFIMMLDSDGQHNPEDIPRMVEDAEDYDMVVGVRQKGSDVQLSRMPGKKVLSLTANYLSGTKIPDLNCGFRIIRLKAFKEFLHIYPNGFSISTTSTMAFLLGGYSIKWVPINTFERLGRKSNVNMVRDGLQTIMLIIRSVALFNPLKIFLPGSFLFCVFGMLYAIFGIFAYGRFPNTAVVIFVFGFLLFFFGILADLISMIRRGSPGD